MGSNAAVSLGGAFISLEISSSFSIFFSLFSFILAWTFISLQIKEFRIMGLSISDSVYSCLFFFLTGLHFFHLLLGVLLLKTGFFVQRTLILNNIASKIILLKIAKDRKVIPDPTVRELKGNAH